MTAKMDDGSRFVKISKTNKVFFGHPKWPIDLKWSEMQSKMIFEHPKLPPVDNL